MRVATCRVCITRALTRTALISRRGDDAGNAMICCVRLMRWSGRQQTICTDCNRHRKCRQSCSIVEFRRSFGEICCLYFFDYTTFLKLKMKASSREFMVNLYSVQSVKYQKTSNLALVWYLNMIVVRLELGI